MEVRRTPDIKLWFVGFIRFDGFNFGQIQKIRLVVVMVRSYSFGHLDLVKLIILVSACLYHIGLLHPVVPYLS